MQEEQSTHRAPATRGLRQWCVREHGSYGAGLTAIALAILSVAGFFIAAGIAVLKLLG